MSWNRFDEGMEGWRQNHAKIIKMLDQLLEREGLPTGSGNDETGTQEGRNHSIWKEDEEVCHGSSYDPPPPSLKLPCIFCERGLCYRVACKPPASDVEEDVTWEEEKTDHDSNITPPPAFEDEEKEASLTVSASESEPQMALQTPPSLPMNLQPSLTPPVPPPGAMLNIGKVIGASMVEDGQNNSDRSRPPPPPPSAPHPQPPPLESPPSSTLSSLPPLGFKNRSKIRDLNRGSKMLEMSLFNINNSNDRIGEVDSSSMEGAIYEDRSTISQIGEMTEQKTATLKDVTKKVNLGYYENGLRTKSWAETKELNLNLGETDLKLEWAIRANVKAGPKENKSALIQLHQQLTSIPQNHSSVPLLPVNTRSTTSFSKPPATQYLNVSRRFNHTDTLAVTVESSVSLPEKAIVSPLATVNKAAIDEDDDSDADLFGEETKEEKKVAEECVTAAIASRKKKEQENSSLLTDGKSWDNDDSKFISELASSLTGYASVLLDCFKNLNNGDSKIASVDPPLNEVLPTIFYIMQNCELDTTFCCIQFLSRYVATRRSRSPLMEIQLSHINQFSQVNNTQVHMQHPWSVFLGSSLTFVTILNNENKSDIIRERVILEKNALIFDLGGGYCDDIVVKNFVQEFKWKHKKVITETSNALRRLETSWKGVYSTITRMLVNDAANFWKLGDLGNVMVVGTEKKLKEVPDSNTHYLSPFVVMVENEVVRRILDAVEQVNVVTADHSKAVKNLLILEKLKKKEYEGLSIVDAIYDYTLGHLKEFVILATKEGLKLEEREVKQQTQDSLKKKFVGIFVSFLGTLMFYLPGWLLLVYLSFMPLHVNQITSVTFPFLHLEDKVKVQAADIDKPRYLWFIIGGQIGQRGDSPMLCWNITQGVF